uniref:Uncharacterized protein n=1 Tax=Scylla olivacea TaxID=85551 RepID=A0A0P4VY09_SCYOL
MYIVLRMVIHSSKYAWNDEHTTPSLNHVGIHHPVNPSQCFYKGIVWHSVIKVFKAFIFDIIVCRVAQVRLGCVINNRCVCACVWVASSSSNNSSRRPSVSVVPSPWLGGTSHQAPSPSGEQIDKFIRHRLQRTNKEGTSGSGLRYSPVHADHSVLAPTPVHLRHHALQHANGGSRAISIPQLPKPLLPPRLRSSVEGLNQEIERLVLRPPHMPGDDLDDVWSEVPRDGRRAPIAEYLRFTRSVDTQTPARGSAVSAASSDHTSPSLSPPTSPPHSQDAAMPSSTPSPTSTQTLATSPHINKFLAREPPDGCERVALKHHEDRSGVTKTGVWPAVRPPGGFTLRASQGSAFCAPERIATEEECGATALQPCQHQTDSISIY